MRERAGGHKKRAEPRTTRGSAPLQPLRHSRLRFQREHNTASAGKGAGSGTTGFVEVEVTASKCRAKDLAVSAEGKHVVSRPRSVGPTEEGIQNRLREAAAGTGRQLVDNATALIRVFRADILSPFAAALRDHAVEVPRRTQGQTGIRKSSIRFAVKLVDEALRDFPAT